MNERDYWIERGEGISSFPPPNIDNMTTEQIKNRVTMLEAMFADIYCEEGEHK